MTKTFYSIENGLKVDANLGENPFEIAENWLLRYRMEGGAIPQNQKFPAKRKTRKSKEKDMLQRKSGVATVRVAEPNRPNRIFSGKNRQKWTRFWSIFVSQMLKSCSE